MNIQTNTNEKEEEEDMDTDPIDTLFNDSSRFVFHTNPPKEYQTQSTQTWNLQENDPSSSSSSIPPTNQKIERSITPTTIVPIHQYSVDTKIGQTCTTLYCMIQPNSLKQECFIPLHRIHEFFESHSSFLKEFISFLYDSYNNPIYFSFLLSFPSKPWLSGKTVFAYLQNIINVIFYYTNKKMVTLYPSIASHPFVYNAPFSPEKSTQLLESILLQCKSLSPQNPNDFAILEHIRSAIYGSKWIEFYTPPSYSSK